MINILVVEDDVKLNQIVCIYLNDSGFHAKGCLNAKEAYDEMYNNLYELIISDIMMPEIDGFEFAGAVRRVNRTIPILFMSAKDDLPSKQKGFQLGIDDYMVKPIELDELLLRVRALLRRANIEMERRITVGNLVLDADGMSAEINGEEINLTTREFNIIYKLLSYPKKTFSRAQLMDEFWGVEGRFYGRFYICGNSAAAPLHFMYPACHTGVFGWIFPYFLYKKIAGKQTEKVTPLIEAKYDEIYEICEKGNKLLY